MLSPSHPGPHKATHLAMCDRTLLTTLVASALPLPIVLVVSDSVGVKCCSSATDDRADDCAFLTTYHRTDCRTCSGANRRGQLVAVLIPKRSFFPVAAVVATSAVNIILKSFIP